MSSKKKAQDRDTVKQHSPRAKAHGLEPVAQPLPPAAIIQQARRDPGSLAPRDALRLQRTVGNQAVGRLLHPAAQRQPGEERQDEATLPPGLQAGIQTLSGLAMDDVTVHYGSSKPAEVQAAAYTQGTDIHLAAGQERHLPHEAWHVVQQKQGRARPSVQWKGIGIDVDSGLETEADRMGARAQSIGSIASRLPSAGRAAESGRLLGQPVQALRRTPTGTPVRQFKTGSGKKKAETTEEKEPETRTSAYLESNLDTIVKHRQVSNVQIATQILQDQREVKTETVPVQEYTILDDKYPFYSATSIEAAENILKVGFDPQYSMRDWEHLTGPSDWTSQGYIYFAPTRGMSRVYAKQCGVGNGFYVIFQFTLPQGTVVTVDPEAPNALRTPSAIPPGRILNASAVRTELERQKKLRAPLLEKLEKSEGKL